MTSKHEIAKEIFQHNLDMTMHEDQKAGRIIISIAFLTSASATVYGAFVKNEIQFLMLGYDFISIFFFLSIFSVVLGSICIMKAIGPKLNLPDLWKDQENKEDKRGEGEKYSPKSIYFYEKIAEDDKEEWNTFFSNISEDDLITRAYEDHIYEAYLISGVIKDQVDEIIKAKLFFI